MITVKPRREEALDAGFRALDGRLPSDYTFAQFEKALEDWDIKAFCSGDDVVGMLMTKGGELHVAVLPEVRGKWLSRKLIREVIGPLVKEYGIAKTSVAQGNSVGDDFVRRIGFAKTERDDFELLREGFEGKYFDPVSAALQIGGSLISGSMQSDAASSAANAQANAANQADQTQLQMFNTINQQEAPYRQAGQNALTTLSDFLGLGTTGATGAGSSGTFDPTKPITDAELLKWWNNPAGQGLQDALGQGWNPSTKSGETAAQWLARVRPSLTAMAPEAARTYLGLPTTPDQAGQSFTGSGLHAFNASDLNANLAPNYDFMLQQGQGAQKNAANLQTGLLSGNAMKGLQDYTQNYAKNAYQDAFNNYNTNQTNIFNRLSTIAGLGQNATSMTGTAGTALAGNSGSAQMASGAAQASGIVGSANALSSGLNNATGWYQLKNMLNPSPASGNWDVSSGWATPPIYSGAGSDYIGAL